MEGLVVLRAATADIAVNGTPATLGNSRAALEACIAYLTEDRKNAACC